MKRNHMVRMGVSAAVALVIGVNAETDPYVTAITVPDCTTNKSMEYLEMPTKSLPPVHIGMAGIWDADDGPADTCRFNMDYTIAINLVNADNTILPDRNLVPIFKDDQGSASNGFLRGMEFCGLDWAGTANITSDSKATWNTYVKKMDVVVGPLYSGITMNMATILGYFEINNISPSATNPGLSDNSKYPFMNRVISNDLSQADAILAMCKYFEWKKIIIAHTTTAYSTGFANAIFAVSESYGVEVVSMVAWETGTQPANLESQALALKKGKAKVIMCTAHDADCVAVRAASVDVGIADYPYLWLYGDSGAGVSKKTQGCLISQPFSPQNDPITAAYEVVRTAWNAADKHEGFEHNSFSYYVRDAVYAAALAFDAYFKGQTACAVTATADKTLYPCDFYKSDSTFGNSYNQTQGKMIRWIIRNLVSFSGASGTVEFNKLNGNRRAEAWSIFNCKVLDAPCEKVGVAENGVFSMYADAEIVWPGNEKEIIAWPVTVHQWVLFSDGLRVVTLAFVTLTWILVLGVIGTSIAFRKRPIMRMSSYKMNAITVLGAALCVSSLYPFVVDEANFINEDFSLAEGTQAAMDAGCIAFPLLLCIGFAMYFGAMGVKLWRVKQIFREEQTLKKMQISDFDLFLKVVLYIMIEVVILVVWMVVSMPNRQIYTGPELPTSNPMKFTIEKYGYCSSGNSIFFYILLIFNVLTVFVVSTWAYEMRNVFYKAVNDSMQIAHITLLLVVFGGFLTALCFFLPRPTDFFVFLLAGTIVVSWASVIMIYFTKFYAIITGSEKSWTKASVAESVVSGVSTANSVVPSSNEGGI